MREWRELHHQLAQTAIEMGLTTKEAAFRRPPEVRQLTSSENAGDQDLSAKLKQKQLDKKQHRAQIRAAKEAGYEQIHRARRPLSGHWPDNYNRNTEGPLSWSCDEYPQIGRAHV